LTGHNIFSLLLSGLNNPRFKLLSGAAIHSQIYAFPSSAQSWRTKRASA
jgi:hypothetical protein